MGVVQNFLPPTPISADLINAFHVDGEECVVITVQYSAGLVLRLFSFLPFLILAPEFTGALKQVSNICVSVELMQMRELQKASAFTTSHNSLKIVNFLIFTPLRNKGGSGMEGYREGENKVADWVLCNFVSALMW